MDNGFSNETMLDIYLYETAQNIEQLENTILSSEKASCFSSDAINEIFRAMHTIKGSSAMMMYQNITSLAHNMEDLFYFLREDKTVQPNCAILSDLVLECVDFIKLELEKIKSGAEPEDSPDSLIQKIKDQLAALRSGKNIPAAATVQSTQLFSSDLKCDDEGRNEYEAVILFEDGCEMENIRAYAILHKLKDIAEVISYQPEDIIENNECVQEIREQGFRIILQSDKSLQEMQDFLEGTAFLRKLSLTERKKSAPSPTNAPASAQETAKSSPLPAFADQQALEQAQMESKNAPQQVIRVDVNKLDRLMDLMGEMVIAEAMVTQNPELKSLQLNSFFKAARQLRKITSEMQDMVMAIRMVPLSATFHKMRRIIRDMARNQNKEIELVLIGEDTEVDKNIIEHISDPLMHLVRNAVDHGIEPPDVREASGKPRVGRIIIEANNVGSDVLVSVRDDGKGLNKQKILQKAVKNGLINKQEHELTEKEIYNLIFIPGFSTNDNVTEYSGRGVGMDVVTKNIEEVGGAVSVMSAEGAGTITTMKIPLTLAIIDGMNIRVGSSIYTIPTTSIQETFRAKEKDIVTDPEDNEMIMVRGSCYPVLRLHRLYEVEADTADMTKGIMLMVESDGKSLCLFADELLGQHQVVVKALPAYIKLTRKIKGLAGCTLLGDGSISLILSVGELMTA